VELSLTDDREGIRVGAGGRQHRPGVREEHREAAHPTATERQHGLVGNPTHLKEKIDPLASDGLNTRFIHVKWISTTLKYIFMTKHFVKSRCKHEKVRKSCI